MFELEIVVNLLQDRNLMEVSRRTGLKYLTVWRIKHGLGAHSSYDTVKRLSDYLEKKPCE